MRADLATLLYLEYRQLANRIKRAARQPSRLALYGIVVAYFIFMGFVRTHDPQAGRIRPVPEPYASGAMFAYLTLLSIFAYGAASGIVGAFSSSADARFLIGSHIPERLVVVWLQLRRSAAAIARMILTILLYTIIFFRSGTFMGIGLGMLGGTLVATATAVPMLKLRSSAGARTAQSLAGACAALAILPMVMLFTSLVYPVPGVDAIERTGAGVAFNALLHGTPAALAALYGFGLLLIALSFVCGTGLYPDLYASSLRVLAFKERSKRGGTAAFSMQHTFERGRERRAVRAISDMLSGPWTIAWKEWIGFLRSPSMQRIFLLGLFGCAAGGALVGSVVSRSRDPIGETIAFASTAANLVVIFVAMGSAIGLGADLRKPLWWLGPDPLWKRLFAWAAGTSWRLAACIAAGLLAWSISMHQGILAAAGIPLAIAGVLHLRVVGLVIYSLFPSSVDQRGPLAMVRALLTYFLAAPPAVAGIVIGVVFHTLPGGLAVAMISSLLETLALLAFASARIDGRGAAFAQAETM